MESLEFLKNKGLIKEGFTELNIATEDAGIHELNELLNEFAKIKVEEEKEVIREWLIVSDFEGLAERI